MVRPCLALLYSLSTALRLVRRTYVDRSNIHQVYMHPPSKLHAPTTRPYTRSQLCNTYGRGHCQGRRGSRHAAGPDVDGRNGPDHQRPAAHDHGAKHTHAGRLSEPKVTNFSLASSRERAAPY
eukprot:4152943-Prymnesium_polylepis.1